ncbi:MAG: membrane protein insertion efficiency factor YidD [Clostridia bacterium]|nr:membrane protein insertion efficiency factor YidD [Clostridia bacterium]MBR6917036.1 membrane protein insertion efficiency factor YidD [Clostridia bacterium]
MKKEKNGRGSRVLKRVLRAVLFVLSIPGKIVSLPVTFYRRFLSPAKSSPSCRFSPTCSEYALISLREWGVAIGGALAVWRVLRCNPFSKGGEDPVPENPLRRRILNFIREGDPSDDDGAPTGGKRTLPDEERT